MYNFIYKWCYPQNYQFYLVSWEIDLIKIVASKVNFYKVSDMTQDFLLKLFQAFIILVLYKLYH